MWKWAEACRFWGNAAWSSGPLSVLKIWSSTTLYALPEDHVIAYPKPPMKSPVSYVQDANRFSLVLAGI